MARLPRLTVTGTAHLVQLLALDGRSVFADDADRNLLLELLYDRLRALPVELHGYVLMPDQVSLLATPREERVVPALMQSVARQYVQAYNRRHGRSGTLWNGRYRCTLLESGAPVLTALTFIETAPVRAGLVENPADYPWSSCAHHAGQRQDRLVTPHPVYWALGNTPFAREAAYADRTAAPLPDAEQIRLAAALRSGWPMGSPAFLEELRQRTQRRVRPGVPGRPRQTPRP